MRANTYPTHPDYLCMRNKKEIVHFTVLRPSILHRYPYLFYTASAFHFPNEPQARNDICHVLALTTTIASFMTQEAHVNSRPGYINSTTLNYLVHGAAFCTKINRIFRCLFLFQFPGPSYRPSVREQSQGAVAQTSAASPQ